MTDKLVADYVGFIGHRRGDTRLTLWLQSPPMSNVATRLLSDADADVFLAIIARFNERLRAEAAARGLPLIDVNAVTTDADGEPVREHYIDTNHVRPTALIAALDRFTG